MFTRNDERIISKYLKRNNLEQSEYCNKCGTEKDISEFNIPKGECFTCSPSKKIKLTMKDIDELTKLDN